MKDGAWLTSSTQEVMALKEGETTTEINDLTHKDLALQGEYGLDEVLEGKPAPENKQIHILVVVPDLQGVGNSPKRQRIDVDV